MARVSAYQGDYTTTLAALDASFFDLAGDLDGGIYHTFSLSGKI